LGNAWGGSKIKGKGGGGRKRNEPVKKLWKRNKKEKNKVSRAGKKRQ